MFRRLFCILAAVSAATASDVPPELTGTWIMRQGSASSYRDSRTGQFSAPNASTFTYTIHPDGRFEHAALLSSSLYQCSMQVFGHETGALDLSGPVLIFTDRTATLKSTDTCRPAWNYEKPGKLSRTRYEWRLDRDQAGVKLVLVRPGGRQEIFYRQ